MRDASLSTSERPAVLAAAALTCCQQTRTGMLICAMAVRYVNGPDSTSVSNDINAGRMMRSFF